MDAEDVPSSSSLAISAQTIGPPRPPNPELLRLHDRVHAKLNSELASLQQAMALDENFMVVRRSANLCLSHDLSGYHMYGPDLCLMAQIAGYRCYVIDFHLRHASAGKIDASFEAGRDAFARKYHHAFRSRWFQTSCATLFLSASPRLRAIARSRIARRLGLTSGMT